MRSKRNGVRQKRIALIGLPVLQEVGNLLNVSLAHHAEQNGNWRFVFNAEANAQSIKFIRTLDCDGALVRITSPAMRREALKIPFPVVNLSSWLEHPDVSTVRVDWKLLGRMAAEHLLEKGFRRFGCVIVPGGWYIQQRFMAFQETLKKHGFEAATFHLRTTHPEISQPLAQAERERFKKWVLQLQPPAALSLTDDWDAPALMDVCREAGRQIPRDLVVMSTGIHSEIQPLCRPALTGAQEDLATQARVAIKLLEDMMAGRKAATSIINVPPLGVVERASTATMAIEDREVAHAVEYIRAHGCEPGNVGNVMARVGISRGTLERRFKQAMGVTPHDYFVEQRIQRAKELLSSSPSPSLEVIAKRCGFRDRPELNRVFKRVVGSAPNDWQKRLQKVGEMEAGRQ